MKPHIPILALLLLSAALPASLSAQTLPAGQSPAPKPAKPDGYKDTPLLPNTQFHVHDPDRPLPPLVKPPEQFSQNAAAPSDAIILFDGTNMNQWLNERGQPATSPIANGAFTADRANGRLRTKLQFADFQMHLEFATPERVDPNQTGQNRGNNGLNIYGIYEIQILDSSDNPTYADGQAAALYGQRPPLVNASKPPGQWQTYDLVWEAPHWDKDGKLTKKAYVTLLHNGILVHNRQALLGTTPYRQLPTYDAPGNNHQEKGFIELYYHTNPVQFRNIWVRPIETHDPEAP